MKDKLYLQCELHKIEDSSIRVQTAYIPIKFAVQGRALKIRDDKGKWEDNWIVVKVFDKENPIIDLEDTKKSIRQHRKDTGDSLPKWI